ncbi:MAG: class I SAM-dependent methyltransferase [Candidatus Lokiarchaeota archaeon]|nr:class I SAM-dependent methyltransferase [Candidatus Lokiarchaeota archaeon]
MNKKEIVRKGYNKVAGSLEEIFGIDKKGEDQIKFLSEFSSRIPLNSRVLDAGCGSGAYSRILSENFEVTGVDISENQIKLAKKNAPKAQLICQDMTTLSFPDDYFNGILSFYAIIHIPREEHYQLLKNFYRILKINGIVLLTFHCTDDPESYVEDFFGPGIKMFWSGFDKASYLKMVQDAGFKIIWSRLVLESPKWGETYHLFVMAEKL